MENNLDHVLQSGMWQTLLITNEGPMRQKPSVVYALIRRILLSVLPLLILFTLTGHFSGVKWSENTIVFLKIPYI